MSKTAFVFSGQGAQYPGMGKELYESSPAARRVLDMAESIRPGILKLCFIEFHLGAESIHFRIGALYGICKFRRLSLE